jgi:MSHA pilin protein MshD
MFVSQTRRTLYKGFTLIELIVFIVIVSVGLAGVMTSLNISVKNSSDPLLSIQAIAIAESLLEEVLPKAYLKPPATVPPCTPSGVGPRNCFDAVTDYSAAGTITVDLLGNSFPTGYSAVISISPVTPLGPAGSTVNGYRVTVTVTYGGGTFALSGYRAEY